MATEEELFGEIDFNENNTGLAGQRGQAQQRRRDNATRGNKQSRKNAAVNRIVMSQQKGTPTPGSRQSVQQAGQQAGQQVRQQARQQPPQRRQNEQAGSWQTGASSQNSSRTVDLWGDGESTPAPSRNRRSAANRIQPNPVRGNHQRPQVKLDGDAAQARRVSTTPQSEEKQPKNHRKIGAAIRQAIDNTRGESANMRYEKFMFWLDQHPFAIILFGVLLVAAGLLINRYISFVGAAVLLLLGWLMGRDDEKEPLICYGTAIAVFIIPYAF